MARLTGKLDGNVDVDPVFPGDVLGQRLPQALLHRQKHRPVWRRPCGAIREAPSAGNSESSTGWPGAGHPTLGRIRIARVSRRGRIPKAGKTCRKHVCRRELRRSAG